MNKTIIWLEVVIALLLGAPVKDRQGRIWRIPYPKIKSRKILDSSLWGVDLSKWNNIVDFVIAKTSGLKYMIFRACYGIREDERFVEYITSAVAVFIGWLFGVYHFYDPVYKPIDQANVLLSIIRPYKKYIRRVWIDLEFTWSGNFAASKYWKEFAEYILAEGYEIGFYTRKTWWDSRVGDLAWWFGQYPLWAAQYAFSLTLIPLGWLFAHLWQDGTPSIGKQVLGPDASYEVDHDIADREFYRTEYGDPVDVSTDIFDGVTRVTGERFGRRFYLEIIDPDKVRFVVRHADTTDRLDLPSTMGKDAQLAWNGDDWIRTSNRPAGEAISDGVTYIPRVSTEPSFIVKKDGVVAILDSHVKDAWQVSSGVAFIVLNGDKPAYMFPPFPDIGRELRYTEKHARSIIGMDALGNVIHLTVDGDYPNVGITLPDAAEIMIEFGAVVAFDQGGGGDSVDVVQGLVMNVPDDDIGGVHYERRVPQALLVYANSIGGSSMYGIAEEIKGKYPSVKNIPDVAGSKQYSLNPYQQFDFAAIVDGLNVPADKWLRLPDGNYVNYIVGGETYLKIVQQPTIDPVPPAAGITRIEMDLAAGSSVTIFRSDGTSTTETT